MTVDEAGQDRRSSDMEPFDIWRWLDVRVYRDDPVALEEQRTGTQRR